MANTDYFTKVGNPGTATTLQAPGHAIGATTFNVVSTANWPTTTGVVFAVDQFDIATGKRVPGTYTEWQGDVTSSTAITNCVIRTNSDQNYPAGSTTRVYIPVASAQVNRQVDGLLVAHNQDGTLKTTAVQTALNSGNLTNTGFNPLGFTPNTVTYNGNRSYTCVFNSQDLTGILSPGMRLRTTRTVAAPTQSTNLNGTNQYWSKVAPAGMTFTTTFTCMAWVKLTSYALSTIMSRYTSAGDDGFDFGIDASGRFSIYAAGAASRSSLSFQSVPLNKWVHLAITFDLAAGTSTIYMDGVAVPNTVTGTGTALVQSGTFSVGSLEGTSRFFPGKIAQAAVFSAVLSAATIQSYYSQGLTGTETSLVSAYSFNGNANDLNTTNANNLTANNGATATNADSPFGGQADGTISSTLDYGIVQRATFSTNTTVVVQVAEGCTVPTSGGVAAVAYSSQKAPFNLPSSVDKWLIETLCFVDTNTSNPVASTLYYQGDIRVTLPVGNWELKAKGSVQHLRGTSSTSSLRAGLLLGNTTYLDNTWYWYYTTDGSTHNIYSWYAETSLEITPTSPTNLVRAAYLTTDTGVSNIGFRSNTGTGVGALRIAAENAYL